MGVPHLCHVSHFCVSVLVYCIGLSCCLIVVCAHQLRRLSWAENGMTLVTPCSNIHAQLHPVKGVQNTPATQGVYLLFKSTITWFFGFYVVDFGWFCHSCKTTISITHESRYLFYVFTRNTSVPVRELILRRSWGQGLCHKS